MLREILSDTPVLLLNGARQTGKTTLVQQLAQAQPFAAYVSLDEVAKLNEPPLYDELGLISWPYSK